MQEKANRLFTPSRASAVHLIELWFDFATQLYRLVLLSEGLKEAFEQINMSVYQVTVPPTFVHVTVGVGSPAI